MPLRQWVLSVPFALRAAGRSFAHAVERAGESGALLNLLVATGSAS